MKKNFSKKIVLLLLLTLAALGGFYFFHNGNLSNHKITLYGNVDIKEVNTSFRVAGRLKNLSLNEGDFVKKDELLATLENDTFSNELELAKANLNATKAKLGNAEKKFSRTKKLLAADSASRQQYDEEKFALSELKAHLESDKVKVKIAQTSYNDTNLYAPSDGFIMTRAFEVGSMMAQNQTVYTLSLLEPAYIRAYVDEKDLGKIENGRLVKIKTDSQSEYEGQVGFISAKAEFTPKSVETSSLRTDLVYRLRILIKNPDAKLKQGMPVTILLE
jgi:HlyD family secretion protein